MNIGAQQGWIAGGRLYFQPDPKTVNGSAVVQPILDIGTIDESDAISPSLTPNTAIFKDADGGITHDIAEAQTSIEEVYTVKTRNVNIDNLAFTFNADGVNSFTQVSTPVTTIAHACTVGRALKIHDANGLPVYGLTSIDAVGSYVVNTHYQIVSLERGIIKFIAGAGGGLAADASVNIGYTPRAITGNRLLYPHTRQCTVTGTAFIFWGRCGNREQSVRECRVSLTSGANTFQNKDWSTTEFKLRVLWDQTNPTMPAGRVAYWLGDAPPLS